MKIKNLVKLKYDIDSIENRDPEFIHKLLIKIRPFMDKFFKPEVRGLDNIPKDSSLFVGNHNSGMLTPDSFIFGAAVIDKFGLEKLPYGLAHTTAISIPILHHLAVPLGAIRASHENAKILFENGKNVIVYPGGDMDAMRSYKERNRVIFGGRMGYIRLALNHGVPIIPVVSAGAHTTFLVLNDGKSIAKFFKLDKYLRIKVWPITLSLPWGLTFGPPPPHFPMPTKITIEVLNPIIFERTGKEAAKDEQYVSLCHERVLNTMQSKLDQLVSEQKNRP
ncbi:MAG: acyltransferase family protein [Bacteriovoracaceae bacterium]|nr:acyltransferase family protein [Bacteriovoracaceae bacterium]